ncbi:methyltransferase domain-containing protein [Solimonas sp. K1W22B-7]|uniref:SAM-dependent methyltransferase n=1 Tax=Solimonas sp. K1W22B-7 TaxID=2303331 RepID=UPI000E3346BF|nr:methyltransferase domain-containing protein [Solimonas sp. K1W22B-7]AXQ31353.1 methyltransferase domain-containing protein [Solimonas sp. K1W22B-7]
MNAPASDAPSASGLQERIRTYYRETSLDYRMAWTSSETLALHFGYWDERTRSHAEALLNLNRELAVRMGLRPGQRLLDAGCGIGGSSLWLARHYGARVTGITLAPNQVGQAREASRKLGVKAWFELADYHATPFSDCSFDAYWAMESLCHSPDKPAALREAARLLVPGGRIGIAEYLRVARPLQEKQERGLRDWLDDWAIPDIAMAEEWREWLEQAGFEDIRITDITDNVRPSLRRLQRMAWFWGFGEWLLRCLRLRTAAQHANIRGSRRQGAALSAGSWRHQLITAVKRGSATDD